MKFETSYISSNTNPTPNVVDWGKNDLICYGSNYALLIYDPNYGSGGKVIKSFVGHTNRVNTVKWIKGKDISYETELVSGASDHNVIVWSFEKEKVVLQGHNSTVNLVDAIYKGNNKNQAIIISAAAGVMKIWYREKADGNFNLHQNLIHEENIATCVKLSFLPSSNDLLLAYALTDQNIYLYTENKQLPVMFDDASSLVGHEDWVRGIDITQSEDDLLVASCSQDLTIRLWRITKKLLMPKKPITMDDYNIYVESVLMSHEGWIYSVHWNPLNLQLLSASIDKSAIMWECEPESNMWLEKMRIGEVGGNTLGFYGALFSPLGDKIVAYSYQGAFHVWQHIKDSGKWSPCVTIGGHFVEVSDCIWEPEGEFLISCSYDQTTRIHAPWQNNDKAITWHEIARPQIHGYSLYALAFISRYKFCAAAEEKVIRVFDAPTNFVENFYRICHKQFDTEVSDMTESKPKGASVPSLGLSNKAVYKDNNNEETTVDNSYDIPEESHFTSTYLTEPPTEETLLQNTLWPETQKLYGHGYEVVSLAASPDGQFLASACKSKTQEHSAVFIWKTSTWTLMQKLICHTLTVIQLQFSPDCKYLLSVSRDRKWALFLNKENHFLLAAATNKETGVHSRIIWACSWAHDSQYFATGSRDGKVAFWSVNSGTPSKSILGPCQLAIKPLEFPNESVTALAFAPDLINGKYLIAIGFESGIICLFLWTKHEEPVKALELSHADAHHAAVKRLMFRPKFGAAGYSESSKDVLQLASCSYDHSVKVIDIYLEE